MAPETPKKPERRSTTVTLPAELYAQVDDESFVLRKRSISATIEEILTQYFANKKK